MTTEHSSSTQLWADGYRRPQTHPDNEEAHAAKVAQSRAARAAIDEQIALELAQRDAEMEAATPFTPGAA